MSSFYDKTQMIMRLLERERVPAAKWADIVLARLSQVESYFREARKHSASGLRGDFVFTHPGLIPWAEQAQVGDGDIFETMRGVVAWVGKQSDSPSLPYSHLKSRLSLHEIMADLFDRCHDLGHELARASGAKWSDNPYPFVLKGKRYQGKGRVLDSDLYMREHHSDLWGRLNGH